MKQRRSPLHFLFDTHAHSDAFELSVWQAVVERAWQAGVRGNLSAGVWWDQFSNLLLAFSSWVVPRLQTSEDFFEHLATSEKYSVLPSLGLHPMEIAKRWVSRDGEFDRQIAEFDAQQLRLTAEKYAKSVWAIGETGFDLSRDVCLPWRDKNELLTAQRFGFSVCVELANELNLPLIVHSRSAWQVTQRSIDDALGLGVRGFMVHCYSGPHDGLKWIEKRKGFASFGGVMTWPDAKNVHRNVIECSDSVLLFETDSPDLPPVFSDGKRPPLNEPAFLPLVVERASQLRGQTIADLIAVNQSNFLRFIFGEVR